MERLINATIEFSESLIEFINLYRPANSNLIDRVNNLEAENQSLRENIESLERRIKMLEDFQTTPKPAELKLSSRPGSSRLPDPVLFYDGFRELSPANRQVEPVDSQMTVMAFRKYIKESGLSYNSNISDFVTILHKVPSPLFDNWARVGDSLFAQLLREKKIAGYFGGNISNSRLATVFKSSRPKSFSRGEENFGDMIEAAVAWYVAYDQIEATFVLDQILGNCPRQFDTRQWVDSKVTETRQHLRGDLAIMTPTK